MLLRHGSRESSVTHYLGEVSRYPDMSMTWPRHSAPAVNRGVVIGHPTDEKTSFRNLPDRRKMGRA